MTPSEFSLESLMDKDLLLSIGVILLFLLFFLWNRKQTRKNRENQKNRNFRKRYWEKKGKR